MDRWQDNRGKGGLKKKESVSIVGESGRMESTEQWWHVVQQTVWKGHAEALSSSEGVDTEKCHKKTVGSSERYDHTH